MTAMFRTPDRRRQRNGETDADDVWLSSTKADDDDDDVEK